VADVFDVPASGRKPEELAGVGAAEDQSDGNAVLGGEDDQGEGEAQVWGRRPYMPDARCGSSSFLAGASR
jgi:hypothetical protein